MGDREEKRRNACSFVPATGVPVSPVDVGRTGFPQFPFDLMPRAIFSPYLLFSLPPLATPAKKTKQLLESGGSRGIHPRAYERRMFVRRHKAGGYLSISPAKPKQLLRSVK